MSFESLIKKIIMPKNNYEVESGEVDAVSEDLFLETDADCCVDDIQIVEEIKQILLSCYIQPEFIRPLGRVRNPKGEGWLIYDSDIVSGISIKYNSYGKIFYEMQRIEVFGDKFCEYELAFDGENLFEMDFLYQNKVISGEDDGIIKIYAYGGGYKFGDNPALIEQQVFHMSNSENGCSLKISKVSDWKNRGVDLLKAYNGISVANKTLKCVDKLSRRQGKNLAELIQAGELKIELKGKLGESLEFSSKTFKHVEGTNFLDIIFEA